MSSENVGEEVPEIRTMTQEAVNEQIKGFIAPVIRQLEGLTRVVQGVATSQPRSHYPRSRLRYHCRYSCRSVRHGDKSHSNPEQTATHDQPKHWRQVRRTIPPANDTRTDRTV